MVYFQKLWYPYQLGVEVEVFLYPRRRNLECHNNLQKVAYSE